MKKYILKIDSLIKTFSVIEAGKDISFKYQEKDNLDVFASISAGDYILGYFSDPTNQITSVFEVKSSNGIDTVVLNKILEKAVGVSVTDEVVDSINMQTIIEITDEEYERIMNDMMSTGDTLETYDIDPRVISTEDTISEDDFRVWLSTQVKRDGSPLSEEFRNGYYYILKAIPSMLGYKSVFEITSIEEFEKYKKQLVDSDVYKEANPNVGSGTLSGALTQYGRYLSERNFVNIPKERLAQILKEWYDKKYVENNITSTLVGFGFKYARSINLAGVSAKALLDLAKIESTMAAYIDRGKDLYAAIEKESIGITIKRAPSVTLGLNYKTSCAIPYAWNRVVFGAPGTGKSHTLNKDVQGLVDSKGASFERVTFHPEYSYASFVGCYKPVSNASGIEYKYVAGPFMRVLVEAYKSGRTESPRPHILLIEELNRARVAAVFGEVFQLLDRDSYGQSEYEIAPSEDVKKYLMSELGGSLSDYEKIRIPNNMFIWATMNSADQGVFPMDTAFKRRWNFKYIGIDDNDTDVRSIIKIGSRVYDWNQLRKAINAKMSVLKVNEDKLLGPYFIGKQFFNTDENNDSANVDFVDMFKNKVLMYLFEDACKQKAKDMFEGCDYSRYSSICDAFEECGIEIFGKSFEAEYYNKEK